MAANEPAEIIIKRTRKSADHGHHGGAWKVAYADFVTAMMAFFLLLWLLNATTEAQKQGIADYFSPISVSKTSGGAGGMLGGRAISSPGAMTSRTAIPSLSVKINPTQGQSEGNAEEEGGRRDSAQVAATSGEQETARLTEEAREAEAAHRQEEAQRQAEEARFDAAEKEIHQAIKESPELKELEKHLIVDHTPEGLRIQVVDRQGKPMFKSGSAAMLDHTKKLIAKIGMTLAKLPNRIRLTGHTDSVPFKGKAGYDNWNLSSDRAQSARHLLLATGLPSDRIESVAGRAASDPLLPDDTKSPRNRRISILVLRTVPAAAPAKRAGAAPRGGAPGTAQFDRDWTGPRVR